MNEPLSLSQCYHYALALNNIGVSLICRGAFQEARLTLLDGCAVMANMFAPDGISPITLPALSYQQLQFYLHAAESRITQTNGHSTNSTRSSDGVHLQMISDSDGTVIFLESLYTTENRDHLLASSQANIFPMRIDNANPDDIEEHELTLSTAIILYNHALVSRCLHIWPSETSNESYLIIDSLACIFLLAAYESLLNLCRRGIPDPAVCYMPQIFLAFGLVIQNLFVLACSVDQPFAVDEYTSKLLTICWALRYMGTKRQMASMFAGAAA